MPGEPKFISLCLHGLCLPAKLPAVLVARLKKHPVKRMERGHARVFVERDILSFIGGVKIVKGDPHVVACEVVMGGCGAAPCHLEFLRRRSPTPCY